MVRSLLFRVYFVKAVLAGVYDRESWKRDCERAGAGLCSVPSQRRAARSRIQNLNLKVQKPFWRLRTFTIGVHFWAPLHRTFGVVIDLANSHHLLTSHSKKASLGSILETKRRRRCLFFCY
jgi:hypothetical protein